MKVRATAFVLVALAVSTAPAQVFRSLPPEFTNGQSFGQAIDANGFVVGYTGVAGPPTLWLPSGTTYSRAALPVPAGHQFGAGNSIGAGGVIGGYTQPSDQSTATATVWTASPGGAYAATPLPAPSDSTLTSAYSVNAIGSAGGFRETASGGTDAVVWDPIGGAYTATLLPGLSGWTDTAATAINDNGDLAGYAFGALGGPRGAIWEKTPSGYVAKEVIAGADNVVISAINSFRTGAGVVNGDQAAVMVFFEGEYYAGELNVPFGSSDSAANAVNIADGLVGYLKDPTTAQSGAEAALWIPGDDEWELVNLDAWFNQIGGALAQQWVLEEATGISDNWLVTGNGVFDSTPANGVPGVTRGFVLDVSSLLPEPSGGAIALIAGSMLLKRRRAAGRTKASRPAPAARARPAACNPRR